ncbi:flagellar basal body-associated FliL family protein [Neobacillus sp. LXY-4]|uniref:flagellar basal body-associated FliL family protein n=1 Tax=Neobacillus sp. LXY-4 TaxID=3379826 RepID=UPI003EE1AA2B
MKKLKKSLLISAILSVLVLGGMFYFQNKNEALAKSDGVTLEELAEQTIETKQISTNLNSDHLIQVKFSIEMDSKKTKKQSEKVVPIIESDIIKLLSKSTKEEFKDIESFEKKIKETLNERFDQGQVVNVYTTELLIQ